MIILRNKNYSRTVKSGQILNESNRRSAVQDGKNFTPLHPKILSSFDKERKTIDKELLGIGSKKPGDISFQNRKSDGTYGVDERANSFRAFNNRSKMGGMFKEKFTPNRYLILQQQKDLNKKL